MKLPDTLKEIENRAHEMREAVYALEDDTKEHRVNTILAAFDDIPWLIEELEKTQAKLAGVEKLLAQRRTSAQDYRKQEKAHMDKWEVEHAHDYRNAARAEEYLVRAVESALTA